MSTDFLNCKPFRVFPAPGREISCNEVQDFLKKALPSSLKGRKPLLEGEFQGGNCLIRWFYHGGIFRNLLKGRYFEPVPRAVRELELLTKFSRQGLPVVKPMLALIEKKALGYRQAVVTVRLQEGRDLATVDSMSVVELSRLVRLLERFFDAGLYHPDLNIKNILFVPETEGFTLLDFDRAAYLPGPLAPAKREKIYRRLFRSFDKLGKLSFWDSFPFETLPPHVGESMKNYRKIRKIRAFLWKLNQK